MEDEFETSSLQEKGNTDFVQDESLLLPPLATLAPIPAQLHTLPTRARLVPLDVADSPRFEHQSFKVAEKQPPSSKRNITYGSQRAVKTIATHAPAPVGNVFNFIQIHTPSGKTDSSGDTQMRAHIMRKYHDDRKKQNKARSRIPELRSKAGAGSIQCEHRNLQVKSGGEKARSRIPADLNALDRRNRSENSRDRSASSASVSMERYTTFLRGVEDEQSTREFLASAAMEHHQPKSKRSEFAYLSEVVCTQCGEVLLRERRVDASIQLTEPFAFPQVAVNINSGDPFNSLPIRVNHRLHGLMDHCAFTFKFMKHRLT